MIQTQRSLVDRISTAKALVQISNLIISFRDSFYAEQITACQSGLLRLQIKSDRGMSRGVHALLLHKIEAKFRVHFRGEGVDGPVRSVPYETIATKRTHVCIYRRYTVTFRVYGTRTEIG